MLPYASEASTSVGKAKIVCIVDSRSKNQVSIGFQVNGINYGEAFALPRKDNFFFYPCVALAGAHVVRIEMVRVCYDPL